MTYRLTRSAAADVRNLAKFIAEHDERAAARFIDGLESVFGLLADRPLIGHRRPDLTGRPVRFWTAMRRYAVIYSEGPPVLILRVRDWRMAPERLLDEKNA